jgi:Zeta toxin
MGHRTSRRGGAVIWTPERNRQQGQVVAGLFRQGAAVPCERLAVIAGGLPGADRPAALAAAAVDRARYSTVSVDTVLEELAAAGMILVVAGLSPMEAADLVHAEAQFVGKRLALRALADGRNLILEVSMASAQSVRSWLSALRSAGYVVTGVFADLGIEESVRRTDATHGAARKNTAAAPATAAGTSRPRPSGSSPAAWARRRAATGHRRAEGHGTSGFPAARSPG